MLSCCIIMASHTSWYMILKMTKTLRRSLIYLFHFFHRMQNLKCETSFLCPLRSIAAHRDHFVRSLSVCVSVLLSGSHTFLVVMHSYVSQATYAFLGMLPLCLLYFEKRYRFKQLPVDSYKRFEMEILTFYENLFSLGNLWRCLQIIVISNLDISEWLEKVTTFRSTSIFIQIIIF